MDFYYRFIDSLEGKPLYVPEKDEFLRYSDHYYREHTPQMGALEDYLVKKEDMTREKADNVADQCDMVIKRTTFPKDVIYNIRKDFFLNRLPLTNFQREEFIRLAADAANNFRHPCGSGKKYKKCCMRSNSYGFD